MKQFLLFMMMLAILFPAQAQRLSLSGVVTDARTGETLAGASILWKGNVDRGVTANANGLFSIPGLVEGNGILYVSFVGYNTFSKEMTLSVMNNQFVEVKLQASHVELEEVSVVELGRDMIGDRTVEVSRHHLTPKAIQSIPTARNDVFKAMRYLPGIEVTEPLSPLVSVRGSDPGENMIMLDGVTIYNPYHFMSSSGIFNMQTVKGVEVLAGGFGAEYGGRNASVINISTKDGDQSGLHGEVHPTTAETKFFLEFPVGNKTTMMTAGRINYDLLGNMMLYSNNYFYDANFSVTHRFSAKNRLTFKYFGSRDHTQIDFNPIYRYMGNSIGGEFGAAFRDISLKWQNQWQNHVATLIWKAAPFPRLFVRGQLSASLHRANNFSEMVMNVEDVAFDTSTRFRSKINDYSGKLILDYTLFYWNSIKAGVEYNRYSFFNASELNRVESDAAERNADLFSFFMEDKITFGAFVIRPGLRITNFGGQGYRFEPRLNLAVDLPGRIKWMAAYGKYNQHIVSMNTQEFEFNQFLDYYYPLGNAEPSLSVHYITGLSKMVGTDHTFSIDLYYKDIARTYVFDLLQSQYEAFALSDKIVAGKGKTLGMELMWRGSIGNVSGWGSYTLSRSTRSFPHIMNGVEYDYDYDRRHSIKAVLNYQATERISYSGSFIAQSGLPRSVESTLQMYYMYDPLTGTMIYNPQFTSNGKNNARMPWLFYLDLGLRKELVKGFGRDIARFFGADQSFLTVNIYNVLFFRRNVLYYLTIGGYDKYIPLGDNYLPVVAAGYTIKF